MWDSCYGKRQRFSAESIFSYTGRNGSSLVLQSFNLRLNMVSDSSDSMLAMIAQIFVPILTPLGLGDWRIATALISGVMAKESVVSTLEVLFSGSISTVLSPLTAGSLLVFSLLYTPCIAAIASVKRELGSKWGCQHGDLAMYRCMGCGLCSIFDRWTIMRLKLVANL